MGPSEGCGCLLARRLLHEINYTTMTNTLFARLQLALAGLVGALTLTGCGGPNLVQRMSRGPWGLFSLLIIILDIVAIAEVVKGEKTTGGKLLWVLLIVFFPVGGLILYWFFGR